MAPFACKLGLLMWALHCVSAMRTGGDLDLASGGTALQLSSASLVGETGGAGGEIICGGPTIWNMITASESVTSIMNIKWAKIVAIANDFIEKMTAKESVLKVDIDQLTERIDEKVESEAPELTTEEELKQLITDSVVEGFESVKAARDSECGRPRLAKGLRRRAFRISQQKFETEADKFFTTKKRLNADLFLPICHAILPDDVDGTWCGQLCQSFMNNASTISSKRAGETGVLKSDVLKKELIAKKEQLDMVMSELTRCQKAAQTFSSYKKESDALKVCKEERFEELQDAEVNLDDALCGLEGIEEKLGQEEEALQAAEEALAKDDVEVADLQKAIEKSRQDSSSLSMKLAEGKMLLESVKSHLLLSRDATSTALTLKGAVSKVMLQMSEFFSEAVLQPLRFMGLDEDRKVEDYFTEDSLQKDRESPGSAANNLVQAVDELDKHCKTTAKKAFAALQDSSNVDLSAMCGFGEPEDFKTEAMSVVEKKKEDVAKGVNDLLSWLDVYRNNKGMTAEKSAQRVAEGETAGFQEIVSVYSRTDFFKDYLKEWRGGGPMLKLISTLEEMNRKLMQAAENAQSRIEDLQEQLDQARKNTEALVEQLKAATQKQLKSADGKAAVEKTIATLQSQSAVMTVDIDRLHKLVEQAREKCKKADEAFVKFLGDLKPALQGSELLEEELRGLQIEGEKNVLQAKRAVAQAERRLLAMQG